MTTLHLLCMHQMQCSLLVHFHLCLVLYKNLLFLVHFACVRKNTINSTGCPILNNTSTWNKVLHIVLLLKVCQVYMHHGYTCNQITSLNLLNVIIVLIGLTRSYGHYYHTTIFKYPLRNTVANNVILSKQLKHEELHVLTIIKIVCILSIRHHLAATSQTTASNSHSKLRYM